jgi:hypothetical protein
MVPPGAAFGARRVSAVPLTTEADELDNIPKSIAAISPDPVGHISK